MPVNLVQYQVTVEIFNKRKISRNLKFALNLEMAEQFVICLSMFQLFFHYYFTFVCILHFYAVFLYSNFPIG